MSGVLIKKGNLGIETDMHKRKMIEETQGEDGHLQVKERGLEQIVLL